MCVCVGVEGWKGGRVEGWKGGRDRDRDRVVFPQDLMKWE
jgi:hypothetical protein